jgi:site-specific DNA-cytosine methylase
MNAFDNGDIRTTILVGCFELWDFPTESVAPAMTSRRARDLIKYEEPIVFYGNRVADIRIQDNKVNTLQARMGTSGNNMPLVATIFSHTQGLDAQPSETVSPTLRAGGAGMAVTYSPSGFADYSEGMGTLKAGMTNNNSPLVSVDEYNGSIDETHHTLRANKHSTGVMNDMTVRRLTPVECERLQGFPDNWTEGQSDSARYKQMGNAVAVPVVEWIIGNICDTLKEAE